MGVTKMGVACLAACLALAVGGGEVSKLRRKTSAVRRLRNGGSFYEENNHIWDRCDALDRDATSCSVSESLQCNAHLSDGPADADIEIRVGGLPRSTEDAPVHVHWWAGRESPMQYDALEGPIGCAVYYNVLDAYPKYWESNFNGGNVLVDANGEATIRVRAPATYMLHCWVLYPHIHLRTCHGDSDYGAFTDTLLITEQGIIPRSCNGQNLQVLSARHYVPTASIAPAADEATTTEPAGVVTTTAALRGDAVDLRIQAAQDALDVDALEFSPVYQCFVLGMFFDHFSSECVEECPPESVINHGQCVLPCESEEGSKESFTVAWGMEVDCGTEGDSCWNSKRNQTLHFIRLDVADHLNIPFQEIARVLLGFEPVSVSGRRLSATATHTAHLQAWVTTSRVSAEEGKSSLEGSFFVDSQDVSDLLGVEVLSFEVYASEERPRADSNAMADDTDPYTPAYDELDGSKGSDDDIYVGSSPVSFLPPEAAIGIAAGVVLVGAVLAGGIYYKKYTRRNQRDASVVEKGVFDINAEKLGADEVSAKPAAGSIEDAEPRASD